jgi:tetratricopeptide (TPR) repeat protein
MWRRVVLALAVLAMAVVVVTATSSFAGPPAGGQEDDSGGDEPDYVSLAAVLVRDGHYDRAERELAKIDADAADDDEAQSVDWATYYTLEGLIALHHRRHKAAVDHFDDAIRHGKTDDVIFVYLAQAYYALENWERTILSVRNAAEAGEGIADLYLMRAHAHRMLGEHPEAWTALEEGAERFPDRLDFVRRQFFLLVELGLYGRASELGEAFVRREQVGVDDFLALGEAFRRAGAHGRAKHLLEEARMRFPADVDVLVHLAHTYMAAGELISAAELLQRAAEYDEKYVLESAELYRRGGALERARYMNTRVADDRARLRQRVALMLDARRFEELASAEDRLGELGLLEDQKLVYTLAYARFRIGDYERAEALLRQITDAGLFDSSVELRRTIQLCKKEPGQC